MGLIGVITKGAVALWDCYPVVGIRRMWMYTYAHRLCEPCVPFVSVARRALHQLPGGQEPVPGSLDWDGVWACAQVAMGLCLGGRTLSLGSTQSGAHECCG